MEEDVRNRRAEEIEALRAYYGNDLLRSLCVGSEPSSSPRARRWAKAGAGDEDDDDDDQIPLEGPWFLRIRDPGADDGDGNASSLGAPTLEIRPTPEYPLGGKCPEPVLHNVMMPPESKRRFLEDLREMYEAEMDVCILWGERCREELSSGEMASVEESARGDDGGAMAPAADDAACDVVGIQTFIPPTTRYNQPIRHFPMEVTNNPKYRRTIIHTPPFHPPKSGPSELMIAHVCTVSCMEHVQWALAELLFNDKKVARATHNMFAYRFSNDGTLVSDNDDDGEKGSGRKLASLLEMCKAEDVLVVVSRWFGGSLLGPARFKWIATCARNGLVQGGFLEVDN
ncbi:hypothetical protein ACHAWF_009578 [Thalassiosira exigua]